MLTIIHVVKLLVRVRKSERYSVIKVNIDRVLHEGLFKLKSAGVSESLLTWFSDYQKDRKQRVVLPDASSSWISAVAGVPQ